MLYMLAHLLYILQPLDIVCFSLLKLKYSQHIKDLARWRIFYINKKSFLPAFKNAFFNIFITKKYKKAFKASKLVPINIVVVLNRFKIQLYTPPVPPLLETLWQSKTLSNILKFGSQLKLISDSFTKSPITAQNGFLQLIKNAKLMLY